MGDLADTEAELIKRNREIAKVRDSLLKTESRHEESQQRNADLLEKNAELDSEVTRHTLKSAAWEGQVTDLKRTLEERDSELLRLREDSQRQLEEVRAEAAGSACGRAEDLEEIERQKGRVAELEGEMEQLRRELAEERKTSERAKVSIDQAEASGREASTRSLDQRRRIKELEEQLQESEAQQAVASAADVQRLEEERVKTAAELQGIRAQLEEHSGVRQDVEAQLREREEHLHQVRSELADKHREVEDHTAAVAALEASRDEARRNHEEDKVSHEEILFAERQRHDEHLEKATQQTADLDGRLGGQRFLLEETQKELDLCQKNEAAERSSLTDKLKALTDEHELAREALAQAQAAATEESSVREARFASELETEEVCARRQSQIELDAYQRAALECETEQRSYETRLAALQGGHEQALQEHEKRHSDVRGMSSDLRQRLAQEEERHVETKQEVDRLKADIEDRHLGATKQTETHGAEVARLHQLLEAEGHARSTADKVAQSNLDEKDSLFQQKIAAIERLEADAAVSESRNAELEAAVKNAQDGAEAANQVLSLKHAQLEGELRTRQERIIEIEGRMESQRTYLEQVNTSLEETKAMKDALAETKGSVEAQLQLELKHKEAVQSSLEKVQDDDAHRIRALEEQLDRDRETHREALEDCRRAGSEEVARSAEKLVLIESELLHTKERCELVTRNKADLQQEIASHHEKHTSVEAQLAEHRAEGERLGQVLEEHGQHKESLEQEAQRTSETLAAQIAKNEELSARVKEAEEQRTVQADGWLAKVQKLDELLSSERELREAVERQLSDTRKEREDQHLQHDEGRRKLEQQLRDLSGQLDSWREKADEANSQLQQCRERQEVQRQQAEASDIKKREAEAELRGELATAEARIRRLETEAQRGQTAVDQSRAQIAELQAEKTAKISSLESRLDAAESGSKTSEAARQAAEGDARSQADERRHLVERAAMSGEELAMRQVEFALEARRLRGSLEESRRTLRSSLSAPSPVQAADSLRISGLETQLGEERRKQIDQAVALQRSERRCTQFEEAQKRNEEQRSAAVQTARDVEKKLAITSEEMRKLQQAKILVDQQREEIRERASMTHAELHRIQYDAKYEQAKTKGALDELRFMLKAKKAS